MSKYYPLSGNKAKNSNYINFYRVLRIIGKNYHCSCKNRIRCAMDLIRKRLNKQNVKGVSKMEILNLIKERKNYLFITRYKISMRTDKILNMVFELLNNVEKDTNSSLQNLSFNHLEKNKFCRNELISDLDDKLDILENKAPKKLIEEIDEFNNNIRGLSKTC